MQGRTFPPESLQEPKSLKNFEKNFSRFFFIVKKRKKKKEIKKKKM